MERGFSERFKGRLGGERGRFQWISRRKWHLDMVFGQKTRGVLVLTCDDATGRTILIGPWKRSDEVMKAKSARWGLQSMGKLRKDTSHGVKSHPEERFC